MKALKFKDIRFFEMKPQNYVGNFDGIFGNVFLNSNHSKNIGIRIAKKLNEYQFTFNSFDHLYIYIYIYIYIYLNPKISQNEMIETKIYDLGWNKDVIFGVDNSKFNNLHETERNLFLAEIAFEVLFKLSENDIAKLNIINLVKNEIAVKQTNTKIFLKEKIF